MSETEKSKPEGDPRRHEDAPRDKLVRTRHNARVDGRELHYTVTTGTIVLKEESEKKGEAEGESEGEKPRAELFFIAYTLDGVEDRSARPVTFSFNGGPGSSSVWLHLGLLGPRRVELDEEGHPPPPPYRLVDNEFSLLAETDLVFIDPVSTGYSRVVPGEKAKQFHGFKKDIESVGDFIRLYATRYGRWGSPKFLVGESYGTTRAAGLSGYLQERHGMYLNGLMLISVILDFQTARFAPGNDLPAILFLPTYAATAWYHGRLKGKLQEDLHATLAEAERFAQGEYATALFKGASLSASERKKVVRKLSRYTGLSEAYVEQTDLRVNIHRFVKELLRDEHRTVGRLDSRFKGIDRDAAGEHHEHDPSLSAIRGAYTATLNDYVRGELGFESDLPYEVLSGRVQPWRFGEHENQYVNVAETLRKAMSVNPHLKVFVANGYYDLATPYFATEYTYNHLGLDLVLRDQITTAHYAAGHMMYVHRPSLERMRVDLSAFLASAVTDR